jgi:hypothetical protein
MISLILSGEEYKLWSSSLCNFLYHSVAPLLLGPNILFSTIFWNSVNLCSSHTVRNKSRQILWPSKLAPDLTPSPLDFLLWGHLKKHCVNKSCDGSSGAYATKSKCHFQGCAIHASRHMNIKLINSWTQS